jgi:hypothetical protein
VSAFAFAQADTNRESRKDKMDWNQPIAVASIASIDRVLEDIDYLFDTVQKPEYPAMIKGFLAQYRNLEGLDKTKPLGVFVFLNEGISPQPTVVGFVPVKDLEALTQTLDEVGFVLSPVEGKENRYTLALPSFSVHIKMAHGYAFFQIKSEALDREFYNPDDYTSALAKEYDIAGSLLLKNVPEPMRMMAIDLARAKMDEKMDRQPGEDEVRFQSRTQTMQFVQRQFEMIIKDGDNLTIGYSLSKKDKQIRLNLGVKANPGSELEKELKQVAKASSEYSYLDANTSDYLTYFLIPLPKELVQKKVLELLEEPPANIPPVLLGDEENPGPVAKMLDSIKATIRTGKLDGHIQMQPTQNKKQALIASLKIAEGDLMNEGQQELFEIIKQAENTPEIQANVAEIEGVHIHKIAPLKNINQNAKDLFGDNPVVFIGCSSDEYWWTIGEEDSLELLKKAITNNKKHTQQTKAGSVLLLSFKMGTLISLAKESEKNKDFTESAEVAFASGGDLLTFYPKISADAASLNLEMGEGFIRLIALSIVNRK